MARTIWGCKLAVVIAGTNWYGR